MCSPATYKQPIARPCREGNLAAVLAIDAAAKGIALRHQFLIYPCVSTRSFWFGSATQTNRSAPHNKTDKPNQHIAVKRRFCIEGEERINMSALVLCTSWHPDLDSGWCAAPRRSSPRSSWHGSGGSTSRLWQLHPTPVPHLLSTHWWATASCRRGCARRRC